MIDGIPAVVIFIYELIDLIPNLILALIPFRDHLRFSKRNTGVFVLILYFMMVLSRILALRDLFAAALLTVVWIILYLGFYLLCIRADILKLLLVLLIILNYGSFTVVIFSHIAFHRFSETVQEAYSFRSCLVLGIVYLISYPSMYGLMRNKVRPLINFHENNKIWRFLWLVPATFCLSYYYNLYANGGIILFSGNINNVLFAVFFNIGALFVTYLLVRLVEESNETIRLKTENYQLNTQFMQYENLKNRMEDAKRAKHDLRQNLTVIQSYLKDNDREGLLRYIKQYTKSLPPDSPILYCEDYALNALIVYYENMAAAHNVQFQAKIEYSSDWGIDKTDMVVLLGNLLENAVEACIRYIKEKPYISVCIQSLNNMLVITLDNTYSGSIETRNEVFISSKSRRPGTGTVSIQKIAEKYNGVVRFDYDSDIFHASVMLCLVLP